MPRASQLALPSGRVMPLAKVSATLAAYHRDYPAVLDLYDRTNPGPHDQLLPLDVLAVNALNAFGSRRSPMKPMTDVWSRRGSVERAVAPVTKAPIETLVESEVESQVPLISDALRAIDEVPGFGETASTKLLHRLRPNVVPIWDSLVSKWYPEREYQASWSAWLRRVYADIREGNNRTCLLAAREAFERQLPILRVWDILLWMLANG